MLSNLMSCSLTMQVPIWQFLNIWQEIPQLMNASVNIFLNIKANISTSHATQKKSCHLHFLIDFLSAGADLVSLEQILIALNIL